MKEAALRRVADPAREPLRFTATEDRAGGEDVVGEAARVGVLLADPPPGLVHQEPVEDVGRFVDGGRDGLGGERENRSETCEYDVTPGSAP